MFMFCVMQTWYASGDWAMFPGITLHASSILLNGSGTHPFTATAVAQVTAAGLHNLGLHACEAFSASLSPVLRSSLSFHNLGVQNGATAAGLFRDSSAYLAQLHGVPTGLT